MTETTYYQRNSDAILNRAKDYYKNDKKSLRDNARDKYRNLSEDGKNKNREYGRNRYHNMSQKENQKLKEHRKNYCEANKKLWFLVKHYINFYEFNSVSFSNILLNP